MLDDIWIGSEASYNLAVTALAKVEAYVAEHGEKDDEEKSPYLSVVDGVGVVSVEGSLYDGTFGIVGKWYGITGYGDIQNAMVEAVQNPEVRSILLLVKSGGGSVAGVGETAQLIENVDKHKAVITYTPSTMASAALWLGAAGRKVLASPTALVGSIGTLIIMASRHRQLKEDGIDAVVVRSGKYKALGHPAEPLSDEAVADAQEKADYLSNIFLTYMADRRGVNKSAADKTFGQGRTFIGEQAKAVGLVDAVVTYSEAFLSAKAQALPDNKPKVFGAALPNAAIVAAVADNASEPKGQTLMPNPHIPSDAELAAMAAGVVLTPEADANAPKGGDTETKPGDAVTVESVQASLVVAEAALADISAKFEEANSKATELQAKVDELTAQLVPMEGLCEIARNGIKSMSVPLNLAAADISGLAGAEVLAKHKEVSEQFLAKFKAKRVSATTQPKTEQPAVATVNPLFAAAAQINTQRKGA